MSNCEIMQKFISNKLIKFWDNTFFDQFEILSGVETADRLWSNELN